VNKVLNQSESMKQEKIAEWRCLNYGECSSADEKVIIPLPMGVPFECPKCKQEDGMLLSARSAFPLKPVLLGLGGMILLAAIIALIGGGAPTPSPTPTPTPLGGGGGAPVVRNGAMIDERTGLPKQVITRPKSKLHNNFDSKSGKPSEDSEGMPAFERLFVFKDEGNWLNVGSETMNPKGWIEKADTIDWPHSLVVEYTSPDNRKPVLFFKDKETPKALCENEEAQRSAKVTDYFSQLELISRSQSLAGADFPVLCVEPRDKIEDLYLLPVIEAQMTDMEGYPTRVLKLSAAARERGATTVADVNYINKAVSAPQAPKKRLPLDIVFVMDMTGTMQPWVDGVLNVMKATAKRFQGLPPEEDLIRMGFWGYQDDPAITGIQYLTRAFTKDLVSPALFATTLGQLKVNRLTADSYPEDVFSGLIDAMTKTPWRSGTTHILILVGDAPGHATRDQGGATGMDAPQVRQRATDLGVKIVAAHIKDSSNAAFVKYHALGEAQFRTLASNDNRAAAFISIESSGSAEFESQLADMLDVLSDQRPPPNPGAPKKNSTGAKIAESLLAAAKVDQVSEERNEKGEVVVPRDFTGWAVDRDLLDPGVMSLEPKLLVSKAELSTLQTSVSALLRQAQQQQIVGRSFFDGVMNMVANTASGQKMDTLSAAVPKFVSGLPYKSDLMEKTAAWWNSRTADQQNTFIRSLEAKLSYYRALNEDAKQWKPLNKGADPSMYVTAIPLTQLP
jgi:serine/threonine-protein kinase PpkA